MGRTGMLDNATPRHHTAPTAAQQPAITQPPGFGRRRPLELLPGGRQILGTMIKQVTTPVDGVEVTADAVLGRIFIGGVEMSVEESESVRQALSDAEDFIDNHHADGDGGPQ